MSVSQRPAGPSRIHSSPLVRWLSHLDDAPAHPTHAAKAASAPATLAEGVAPWLAWTDAIALSAALKTPAAGPVQPAPAAASDAVLPAVAQARQAQAELSQAIRAEPGFTAVLPDAAGLNALRGHLRLHQRAMAARIPPLRARLRQTLAAQGPAGAQLASLDAVLEQALATRERQLLDTLPARLTRALAQPNASTATAGPQAQGLLLAELAHRLQPVDGLLQALGHAATGAT